MEVLYQQFTREREFLSNVSPRTLAAYRWAWKAFEPVLKSKQAVTKAEVMSRITELRQRGLSSVTVNTYLRSVNAFCRWMFTEGHTATLVVVRRLKEDRTIIQAFSEAQVERLVSFRTSTLAEQRVHTIACLILDTGIRIDEALSIERSTDLDMDQLLLTVRKGKGGKGRVIPMSLSMRKVLFRYMQRFQPDHGDLLFYAGDGERLQQRNALRDFKLLCDRASIAGVRCSFHTLRHAFSLTYLRNGGDVFRLQRVLGHAKLEMTRRYVNLETEDLQAVHHALSSFASASRR